MKAVLKRLSSISIRTVNLIKFLLVSGFEFFETSAKDNINVKQVFERYVAFFSYQVCFNFNTYNEYLKNYFG